MASGASLTLIAQLPASVEDRWATVTTNVLHRLTATRPDRRPVCPNFVLVAAKRLDRRSTRRAACLPSSLEPLGAHPVSEQRSGPRPELPTAAVECRETRGRRVAGTRGSRVAGLGRGRRVARIATIECPEARSCRVAGPGRGRRVARTAAVECRRDRGRRTRAYGAGVGLGVRAGDAVGTGVGRKQGCSPSGRVPSPVGHGMGCSSSGGRPPS